MPSRSDSADPGGRVGPQDLWHTLGPDGEGMDYVRGDWWG